MLALQVRGRSVTTIEGLRGENGQLHPVQQAFVEHGGLQCGYCTPGFIMTATALLDRNPRPTAEEVRAGLSGNLCRCTGYVGIVESILAAAEKNAAAGPEAGAHGV
jgi:carbon-monoxide dehydrogenase small subunit